MRFALPILMTVASVVTLAPVKSQTIPASVQQTNGEVQEVVNQLKDDVHSIAGIGKSSRSTGSKELDSLLDEVRREDGSAQQAIRAISEH